MNWLKSISKSVFYILLWIFIAKELEIVLKFFHIEIASPNMADGNWFVSNFIEWFGVLYGILLPLILVRAWEQLDTIDREFDREADTVKILYEDLYYLSDLDGEFSKISNEITILLRTYVKHVIENYKNEIKQSKNDSRFIGDKIIEGIRKKFKELIHSDVKQIIVSEILIKELFERLNELVDNRGDRISHASQRLFENLRTVALITSIVFLIPFYFAGPTYSSPTMGFPYFYLLDVALVLGVTFLVIYIYMIIEDLDEPFDGPKSISDESWQFLLEEMKEDQEKVEQENQIREVLYKENLGGTDKTVKDVELQMSQKPRKKPKSKK